MVEENYKKALQDAMRETEELLSRRSDIDKRLAQLKTTVLALFGLLQDPPQADETSADIADLGISEAIRKVLIGSSAMTPAQVKARLTEGGFDLSKYSNPSAVIHNTIKRLEAQGEVIPVRTIFDETAYTLAPNMPIPAFGENFPKIQEAFQSVLKNQGASQALEAFKKASNNRAALMGEQYAKLFPKREGGSK